ncbi:hypothetical protein ACI3LZ_000004 [Candidozyma auris]
MLCSLPVVPTQPSFWYKPAYRRLEANLRKHCLSLLKKTHIVPSFRRIFFINSFEIELSE